MKAIATLVFVLLIGFSAQAGEGRVVRFETNKLPALQMEMASGTDAVARLYRNKYSRIEKELSFTTRRTTSKLA